MGSQYSKGDWFVVSFGHKEGSNTLEVYDVISNVLLSLPTPTIDRNLLQISHLWQNCPIFNLGTHCTLLNVLNFFQNMQTVLL